MLGSRWFSNVAFQRDQSQARHLEEPPQPIDPPALGGQ